MIREEEKGRKIRELEQEIEELHAEIEALQKGAPLLIKSTIKTREEIDHEIALLQVRAGEKEKLLAEYKPGGSTTHTSSTSQFQGPPSNPRKPIHEEHDHDTSE